MSSENPYKTPEVTNPENWTNDGSKIANIESKRLQKLYYRSGNVGVIVVLLIIGAVVTLLLLDNLSPQFGLEQNATYKLIMIVISVFNLIAAAGLWMRKPWGRTLGYISCAILLINIPVGTIVGIVGFFAFSKSPELFGSDRFKHGELKKEFKKRKKQKRL